MKLIKGEEIVVAEDFVMHFLGGEYFTFHKGDVYKVKNVYTGGYDEDSFSISDSKESFRILADNEKNFLTSSSSRLRWLKEIRKKKLEKINNG